MSDKDQHRVFEFIYSLNAIALLAISNLRGFNGGAKLWLLPQESASFMGNANKNA